MVDASFTGFHQKKVLPNRLHMGACHRGTWGFGETDYEGMPHCLRRGTSRRAQAASRDLLPPGPRGGEALDPPCMVAQLSRLEKRET